MEDEQKSQLQQNYLHLHNSTEDLVGGVTLSQPAKGKDLPKKDPTTIKTQLHPENQHKRHKGHPKSIKFRRSKRLQNTEERNKGRYK